MVKIETVVKLETGLHARPAAELVKLANTFKSTILLEKQDKKINAKDIWEILSSNIEFNDNVIINCEGEDEKIALDSISKFIANEVTS